MPKSKKAPAPPQPLPLQLKELKATHYWAVFDKLLGQRYRSHHSALETAKGDVIIELQGKIRENREIRNWFDEEIARYEEEQLLKLQQNSPEEQY